MTYCVGMRLDAGLVFLSDSRTNAGVDQIGIFRKMTIFERQGERVIVLLGAGNLGITQSVRQLLVEPGPGSTGIWEAATMYDAALAVGRAIGEGILLSSEQPAFERLPDLAPYRHDGGLKRAITLMDLLTMSSALDCNDFDARNPGNEEKMYPLTNWSRWAVDLPVKPDYRRGPGGRGPFSYCTGGTLLLGAFTRPVAFVLSGLMAFAYWIAHAPQSPFPVLNGGDGAVLFCFVFLYLVFAGGGAWSVDAWRGRR